MPDKNQRFYRYQHRDKQGWVSCQATYRETDLWIRAKRDVKKEALAAVLNLRRQLHNYIARFPEFLHSLTPLPDDPLAPPLVRRMLQAALKAQVGPMAGVAGAIAQSVADELGSLTPGIIIENGGDCYMNMQEELTVGIYAGPRSPFSGKIALRFLPERFPIGICTSSRTIGHSLSFGKTDALTVISKDAALADAAATALGNLVMSPADIPEALEQVRRIPAIEGVIILIKDKVGIWGDLEIVPL